MTRSGTQTTKGLERKTFTLGGRSFSTKKAVMTECRRILYDSPIGERLDCDVENFLADLLRRHRFAEQKIGRGIAHFTVEVNPQWQNRCFNLHRADGTSTDFSFVECISPTNQQKDFEYACRRAVEDQIVEFREQAFGMSDCLSCPITGEVVSRSTCHIDHMPPCTFKEMVAWFIREHKIDVDSVSLAGHGDNSSTLTIVDGQLRKLWQDYHQSHASLRVVSKPANLGELRRKS